MYYNTNKETGKTLENSQAKAKTQEQRVLAFFRINEGRRFSPSQIQLKVFWGSVPLTSVRRAMTNLASEGYLAKTDAMIVGKYGKLVHTWTLNNSTA